MLEERELDMGHARAILGIPAAQMQTEIARRAVQSGWSVRATEQAVRAVNSGSGQGKPSRKEKDPDIQRMEQELSERLGAPVEVEHKGKGGRLVVRYHSLEELEGILTHFR
jgi:ParB family chromosome partitioning protein